eukprot:SAG22_NODE_2195_length_2853_cov_3.813362_3_plen_157_part_00
MYTIFLKIGISERWPARCWPCEAELAALAARSPLPPTVPDAAGPAGGDPAKTACAVVCLLFFFLFFQQAKCPLSRAAWQRRPRSTRGPTVTKCSDRVKVHSHGAPPTLRLDPGAGRLAVTKPGGNHMMSPESYGSTPGLVNEGIMRSNDMRFFFFL